MNDDTDKLDEETGIQETAQETAEASGTVRRSRRQQISINELYCTRMMGTDCARCQMACPAEAISFDDEDCPVVDAEACTRCGICLSICETFGSAHMSMEDIHNRFTRVAKRGEGVVVTCQENIGEGVTPAANVVSLPCLACLSPEFWTLLLAENIKVSVSVNMRNCPDCEKAGSIASMLYGRAIETAESYCNGKIAFLRKLPTKEEGEDDDDPTKVDRRAAWDDAVDDVKNIAKGKRSIRGSKTLNDYVDRREKEKNRENLRLVDLSQYQPANKSLRGKIMWPKRQLLLAAIDADPEIADRVPINLVHIDAEKCSLQGDCIEVCPAHALRASTTSKIPHLDARYCIACGLCVSACMEGAVSFEETTAAAFQKKKKEEEVAAPVTRTVRVKRT